MALIINPGFYDFGDIANGATNPFIGVQVTNTSNLTASASVINSDNFYYSGGLVSIPGNTTVIMNIYALTSNDGAHDEVIVFGEDGSISSILEVTSVIIASAPAITVTPASNDFGILYVNDTEPSVNITITNTGNIALILTYNDGIGFKFSSLAPGNANPLQPGASIIANIKALTDTSGVFSESLSVTTDQSVSDSILLESDIRDKTYHFVSSPLLYDFGTLDLNDAEPYFTITINNTGNQTITLLITSSESETFYPAVASITLDSVTYNTVRVYAKTGVAGEFTGNILITETVTNVVDVISPVSIVIVDDVRTFTVNKQVIDFGSVDLNEAITPTDTFTITNTSPSASLDFQIIDNYEFTVTPLTFQLPAFGDSQILTVTAATNTIGYFNLYIYIRENGELRDDVNLRIRVNDPNNLLPVKNGLVIQYEDKINYGGDSYITAPVGTYINKWVDISGNNNDADVSGGSGGSVGYPVVVDVPFRGIKTNRTAGVLSVFDTLSITTLTGERTVFYVGTRNRVGNRTHIFTTVGGDRGVIYSRSTDLSMFEYADSGLIADYLAPPQSFDEIAMPMYRMRASDGAINGNIDGAETISATTADTGIMNIDQIGGGRIGTSDYEFIMAAFIVYDRFLTDQEVIDVEDYLSNKYSIPLHRLIEAPTNLVATLNFPDIEITWVNPPAVPFTAVHLERRINASTAYTEIYNGSAISTYVDSDVVIDNFYTYRVRVTNTELGEITYSAYSNFHGVAVVPNAPDPISNLGVFENSYHLISLSWDNPDYNNNSITSIEIERRVNGDLTYVNIATIAAWATGYNDSAFATGVIYDFRVRNVWNGGNLSGNLYSDWVEIIGIQTVPSPPNDGDDSCFSVPGIVEVYIAKFTDNVDFTYRTLNYTGIDMRRISSEIMEYTGIDKWFSLHVNHNADFTQNMMRTNRGAVFINTLRITFSKADPSKYTKLMDLINSNYVVVFKDSNEKLWTFGYSGTGASVTTYERETTENEFVIEFSDNVSDKIITRLSDFYYKRYIL